MKLTIAEIRDYYRKSTDKEAAIKELIISEGSSEKLIRCYVHDVGPSRPADVVAPSEPIKKKMGRPVKNLKPTRELATPREEKPAKKAPVKARPVDKVMPMASKTPGIVNEAPDPVIKKPDAVIAESEVVIEEPKPKDPTVQFTHFEPVTLAEREMFFADITEDVAAKPQKPPMALLGQKVNNFEDVTRVMQEANATRVQDTVDPFSALRKVKEMCWPPKVVIEQTRIPDEKCDVCKNYGDFCTTCHQYDGFESKFTCPIFFDGLIRPTIMPTIKIEEVEAQPKSMTHILKCQKPYFNAVWDGQKTFEVRINDRDYKSGDSVVLKDYNASDGTYGDRQIRADIGFLLSGEKYPFLNKDYVVFTLLNIKRYELQEVNL